MSTDTLTAWIEQQQNYFEKQLDRALPTADTQLQKAMRYSALNGGKRLRPLLIYATGLGFSSSLSQCDPAALAIELIHCYSLVHDDLPAMDDDDLRRGNPSCHKAFDEATAILVGDALQSLAFELLSNQKHPQALAMVQTLAYASGAMGMAGGQSLDMLAVDKPTSLSALEQIHQLKTGALFRAALRLGALAASQTAFTIHSQLDTFAHHFGLAFQIRDDILDVEADSTTLGKTSGKDAAQNKATYPSLLGLDGAKQELQHHINQAKEALNHIDCFDPCYLHTILQLIY